MADKTFWIVWNEARSEGFITDDERDAESVISGSSTHYLGYPSHSTAGMGFREAYEEDRLTIERVQLNAEQGQ